MKIPGLPMGSARVIAVSLSGALLVGHAAAGGTPHAVMRCGWFSNPTPANAWLIDREAQWTVGTQGGPQAEGDWPEFKPSQWVRTNGSYGYGCACMAVVADPRTREISVIESARARRLDICRHDRRLKAP